MNREQLKELGLTDEQVDATMRMYGQSVQELKSTKDEYDTIQSEKAELESQLNQLQQTLASKDEDLQSIDDLKNQIEGYKLNELKVSVARQIGLPYELINRLNGNTEEELTEDAKNLANFVNVKQSLPLKPTEPPVDDKNTGLKQMLTELTNN